MTIGPSPPATSGPATTSLQGGGRFLASSGNARSRFAGISSIKHSTAVPETVSQGVARRRDASRVPQMCPECVRAFYEQTTRSGHLQAFFRKPSDGLEPSTPSLPWNLSGNRWQPVATDFACFPVSRASRFASDCGRLQPRGSINAPSPLAMSAATTLPLASRANQRASAERKPDLVRP